MKRHILWVAILALAAVGNAWAQGTQSGTIAGTVKSADGLALPGATVTAKSPALQGARTVVSDANGNFILKALPSGLYTLTFEMSGMAAVEQKATVALGSSITVDASLKVASVQESVSVTAEAPSVLQQTTVGANYKGTMIDSLATARTLQGVALLAPGLTNNTPNGGQLTIAGSFAYDNVFMVDGVDVNDNLFASPNNLFIEDAIEETQVLTSAISAEYGRFSGGVVNAVTKRGGNDFSGSFRANLSKPSWRDETPFEDSRNITRSTDLSKFYEATLGGPIVKDRLWFFAAGRKENTETQTTLPESGLPFTSARDQKRAELKLTGAINTNHTVTGTYTKLTQEDLRQTFNFSIEPAGTSFTGKAPNDLLAVAYNGVLRPNLLLEAQFSKKKFEFVDNGGTSTAIIDSPYIAQSVLAHYNAPYFDATDPEERNNRQITGALSYFASTKSMGRHDIKLGFEAFRSTRTGGNSQSPTNYVFYTDYVTDAAGKPVFDSANHAIPVFTPGVSQLQNWIAVRGAKVNLDTNALYLNDKWALNNHWSFNIGARFEKVTGDATGDIQPVDASRIVPRLAAAFDVRGDGKYKLDASYSHYAGKLADAQFANNTNVGNPDAIYYLYTGPAGQGRAFAPGINPANYTQIIGGTFPTANVQYASDIKTPVTKEWTTAAGADLGKGGYFKLIYTNRKTTGFVQKFVNQGTGTTDVVRNGTDFGSFSNQVWGNTDDGERMYSAVQLQTAYRFGSRWNLQGHYTMQLKNDGNQEGEAANQPGAPSPFSGFYPELFNEARSFPIGHLVGFQRHRVRAWTTYDLGLGRIGSVNVGLLYRFDSGTAFSLRSVGQALSSVQRTIGNALYPDLPTSQTIFYSVGRGTERFENSHLFDLAVNYRIPIVKTLAPWVKVELRNMFNSTPLIGSNITVNPDPASPRDALGLPTGFIKGAAFGTGTATTHYPFPRELFVTLGVRF